VILRLIVAILVMAAVAAGVFWMKRSQEAAVAQRMAGGPPPATVTDTRVEATPWAERIEAVGSLTAVQDVAIASEVSGKVESIAFDSGVAVEAGDVLLRLDDSDDRAQLQSLQAELELARIEHERVRQLRGSAAFSQSLLDRTQSQMASLAARVERQALLVRKKTLRAPFDGVLGIRQVSLGTIVAPGDPIVRLQSVAPIYVDFTVSERHRGQLEPGQRIEVEVAAWAGERFVGTLRAMSPAVDLRSRTIELRGELDNADQRLQPGMFATVYLILGSADPALTLPRTAVSFFAYGESVFVIDEGDGGELRVHRQPVQVGRTRDGRVEILDGLAVGQRVVHTGHLKLREGQAVVVTPAIALPQDVVDG